MNINLFDANGRLVRQLFGAQKQQGWHTLIQDAGELSNGVYFVKLNMNGRRATHKIVKGR